MVASVSSSTLATETAFSSAMRTTLVGSMMPASTRSTYSLRAGVEAEIALAAQHARHDHAAVDRGVLGDLAGRGLERALEDLHAGPLVAFAFCFLLRRPPSMQRSSASPPPGTMPSATAALVALMASSSASFLRLHLGFGRRADADDGDAAGELGQPLLSFSRS